MASQLEQVLSFVLPYITPREYNSLHKAGIRLTPSLIVESIGFTSDELLHLVSELRTRGSVCSKCWQGLKPNYCTCCCKLFCKACRTTCQARVECKSRKLYQVGSLICLDCQALGSCSIPGCEACNCISTVLCGHCPNRLCTNHSVQKCDIRSCLVSCCPTCLQTISIPILEITKRVCLGCYKRYQGQIGKL
jgi:hypothetical protein